MCREQVLQIVNKSKDISLIKQIIQEVLTLIWVGFLWVRFEVVMMVLVGSPSCLKLVRIMVEQIWHVSTHT